MAKVAFAAVKGAEAKTAHDKIAEQTEESAAIVEASPMRVRRRWWAALAHAKKLAAAEAAKVAAEQAARYAAAYETTAAPERLRRAKEAREAEERMRIERDRVERSSTLHRARSSIETDALRCAFIPRPALPAAYQSSQPRFDPADADLRRPSSSHPRSCVAACLRARTIRNPSWPISAH